MIAAICASLLLVVLALAGCVSLTPQGAQVSVIRNPNDVLACQKVGYQVSSVSGMNNQANNDADIRNQTARARRRHALSAAGAGPRWPLCACPVHPWPAAPLRRGDAEQAHRRNRGPAVVQGREGHVGRLPLHDAELIWSVVS